MALPTVGTVFCVIHIFVKKFIHFLIEKMICSERLGLVKHIYSIQAKILIRLLWLSGVSKLCVSFAKYMIDSPYPTGQVDGWPGDQPDLYVFTLDQVYILSTPHHYNLGRILDHTICVDWNTETI